MVRGADLSSLQGFNSVAKWCAVQAPPENGERLNSRLIKLLTYKPESMRMSMDLALKKIKEIL